MAHYIVRFFKTLTGDQGQARAACRRVIDINACNATEAASLAKRQFCELREIREWSLLADRIDVGLPIFPS